MLDLILSVCCSLAIGMIFKHAGRARMDRLALLAANYAVAVGVALGLLALGARQAAGAFSFSLPLLALGVTTGALFIGSFFVYALATQVAGMSLAIGVMRVSVVIPFLASWVLWREVPTPAQGAGLAVAGAAFFLIARRRGGPSADGGAAAGTGRVLGVLALLFCAGGLVDVLLKTFDEVFAVRNSQASFLLLVYSMALLIGAGFVLSKGLRTGGWPRRATLLWGALLGLANYGSTAFFLRAIQQLTGPFVFPANNIALVLGGALLGVFVWGESLTRLNWLGLALAAGALVLLNL